MVRAISNAAGLSALFSLNQNLTGLNTTIKRLSTGQRINSGKDDPAGLIAAEQLASELAAVAAQTESAQRMDANASIAEGSAAQVSSLYTDLNGLVVQGANTAGMSDSERAAVQMQIDTTVDSIQSLTGNAVTSLNGIRLPNGGNANASAELAAGSASASSLTSAGANSLAGGNFDAAQAAIAAAAGAVSTVRGTVGAYQRNTLQTTVNSNNVAVENLSAARSDIMDTDYAREAGRLALNETLVKAGFQAVINAQRSSGSVVNLLR